MIRPCPEKIDCTTGLLLNYSAERLDLREYVSVMYGADGCIGRCTSLISQEDADLCALRQLALCENPNPVPNDPQECDSTACDDTTYTYRVPAGTFLAATLEEANAMAKSYACRMAEIHKICIGPCQGCCCLGEPLNLEVSLIGAPETYTCEIVGSLPDGLTLADSNIADMTVRLEGTPTVEGSQSFTIRVTDLYGNTAEKQFRIAVLSIVTNALPNYTTGVAYSAQLNAVGGSGNYLWRISSGGLPDGLSLSPEGLIFGTPTSSGLASFTVNVEDVDCQASDRAGKTPVVTINTVSTTRIATLIGYDEFIPSNPPKKYMSCTWTGYSEHQGVALCATPNQYCLPTAGEDPIVSPSGDVSANIAHARYVYDGTGQIAADGTQLSRYTKKYYSACPGQRSFPILKGGDLDTTLHGYCWQPDASGCKEGCEDPMSLVGDVATNSSYDFSDLWYTGPTGPDFFPRRWQIYDSTHAGQDVDLQKDYLLVDQSFGPHFYDPTRVDAPQWTLRMTCHHHYSVTLADEYTDAMALAHAKVIHGNSRVAGNNPRTHAGGPSFVSRYTTVEYMIGIMNLIIGETYELTIEYINSLNVPLVHKETFVASDTIHQVTGSIPTPAPGDTLKLNRAFVNFAD